MKVFRTLYSYNQSTCQQPDFFLKKRQQPDRRYRVLPELVFLFIQKREMGEPTHKSEAANQRKLRCTCTTSSRGRGYNQTILLHARHVTKINTLRTVIQVEYIFTNKIKHKPAVNLQMS